MVKLIGRYFEDDKSPLDMRQGQKSSFGAEIELGDTTPLREKVAELNGNGIKTNFVFVTSQSTTPNA